MALRLRLLPDLPLSRYKFCAYEKRRQFWDIPNVGFASGVVVATHPSPMAGLGRKADIQGTETKPKRRAAFGQKQSFNCDAR